MAHFVAVDTADIRFPTSRFLDGSDAMNPDPDYSAAYLRLVTDDPDELVGVSLVFTIGRGNDIQAFAVDRVAQRFIGRDVDEVLDDLGAAWRELLHDSQLRWLGPEKGVMHMAMGAVINALWDLKAKRAGLPLWDLVSAMTPEEIVDLTDLRYLADVLTADEALDILRAAEPGRRQRREQLLAQRMKARNGE